MNAGSSSVPPPHIALTFVAIAFVTLVGTSVWTLVAAVAPLALLHALAVGVFLMVAMGLLYQFVPVVAMSPLRFRHLPLLHAAIATSGTLCIVIGFQNAAFGVVRAGGDLALAGLGIELFVLVATVLRGRPPLPVRGALLALVWLCLAMATGIWMAGSLAHDTRPGTLMRYHAVFGLIGFFATIITAITFRLLRMFERVNRERRTLVFTIGSSVVAVALASGIVLGEYLAVALAGLFCMEMALIALSRNPAYQPETLAYSAVSAVAVLAAALCSVDGLAGPAVAIMLWLFIGTAVIGYVQRIVPFIWWIARSHREGARNIPTLGEMNHSALGYCILFAWVFAGLGWLFWPQTHIAAAFSLVACGALAMQLSRPFLLQKN